jgi:hypothetical protein
LLTPDETTIAMLDNGLRTPFTVLPNDGAVATWFNVHGRSGRVLVLLPGHAAGELTGLLDHFHPVKPPGDGTAGTLAAAGVASLLQRYEVPQGRRYALLGPPAR